MSRRALLDILNVESLDDVVGKDDRDFWPAELAEPYRADDRRVMESGESLFDREEKSGDSAGNETWLLTTKVPVYDASGEVSGLVGIGRNITKRKLAQQQMQRQTLEARLLYHSTTLAGQTSSFTEALQGCTDLVCELTGWPVGRSGTSICPMKNAARWCPRKSGTKRTTNALESFSQSQSRRDSSQESVCPVGFGNIRVRSGFAMCRTMPIFLAHSFVTTSELREHWVFRF
jgi:hypothetical protein